jgi:hypothetical protein
MSLSNRRLPTTDLYFANACMPWISKSSKIRCEGPNSFSNERAVIICRQDNKNIVRRLIKDRNKVIYYIIDDNLWDIDNDNSLPKKYKKRLIKLRDGQHADIIKIAETVIVPSEIIESKYRERGYNTVRLNPYWSEDIPNSWNFVEHNNHSPLKIGYLGTASHVDDRRFVIQVYQGLLESRANVELTIIGSDGIDKKLLNEKKIKIQKYEQWNSYRNLIQNLKFDILLYPIFPSKFNDARSMSKIVEHALCGGLGVYSDSWEHADTVSSNRIGFTWKNDANLWIDRLTLLSRKRNLRDYVGDIKNIKIFNEQARLKQIEYWSNVII